MIRPPPTEIDPPTGAHETPEISQRTSLTKKPAKACKPRMGHK